MTKMLAFTSIVVALILTACTDRPSEVLVRPPDALRAVTVDPDVLIVGDPCEMVVWSPDARRAAVIMPDGGLSLSDESGKLTPVLSDETDVGIAAWMADSKRLVVVTGRESKTWKEVAALLDSDRQQEIIALAKKVPPDAATDEDVENTFESVDSPIDVRDDLDLILLYLCDHGGETLRTHLRENIGRFSQTISTIALCDTAASPANVEVIAEMLGYVESLRISPLGTAVGFTNGSLQVVAAKPKSRPEIVSYGAAADFDWTPDGKWLVYTTPMSPMASGLQLGEVVRKTVCDDAGNVLSESAGEWVWHQYETIAVVAFTMGFSYFIESPVRVRCLRDGGILFSALDLRLPCTNWDMPDAVSLFTINPDKQAMVAPAFARRTYAELADTGQLEFFQLSPDQERIAVVGPYGEVSVVTLATGEVEVLQPVKLQSPARMLPAWRSNDELCFVSRINDDSPSAAKEYKDKTFEEKWEMEVDPEKKWVIVLWSLSKQTGRVLNETWFKEDSK